MRKLGRSPSVTRRGRARKPVVDRLAEPVVRNRLDGDRRRAAAVERLPDRKTDWPPLRPDRRSPTDCGTPTASAAAAARLGRSASSASPGADARDIRGADRAPRRIMGRQHAGRFDACRLPRRAGPGARRSVRSPRRQCRPGASRCSTAVGHLDDRRFQTDRGRPAVDDQRDALAEIGGHRGGGRRADACPRNWRSARQAAGRAQRSAPRKAARHAQRHRVEPGRDQRMDRRARPQRQHQCQRARPECVSEPRDSGSNRGRPLSHRRVEPHGQSAD